MAAVANPGRSAWQVALHVWHALFMRDLVARINGVRFGWLWMVLEPILHVVLLIAVRELLGRTRLVTGAEFIPWLVVGILSFFLFRDCFMRPLDVVRDARPLFTFRQILPGDVVLVRCAVEGVLRSIVFVLILAGFSLLGFQIWPAFPIEAALAWGLIWLLGTGLGLTVSVLAALVPEIGRVIRIATLPLYIASGVIVPLMLLPHAVQEAMLYNPAAHVIDLIRRAFFPYYYGVQGVNLLYPLWWALASLTLGLALHVRFGPRIRSR